MKFWKKWSFFIIFFVCGAVVMTATDSWAAAGEPAKEVRTWLDGVFRENPETEESGEKTSGDEEPEGNSGNAAEDGKPQESQENPGENQGEPGTQENMNSSQSDREEDGEASAGENTGDGDLESGGTQEGGFQGNEPGEGETDPTQELTYRDPEDVVYTTVEDDYFSDAVFIGDSRMVGMHDYGGLTDISTFYVSKGLTIFKRFTAEIVDTPEGGKITVEQALTENKFAKIYLEVGINEMGTGDLERFLNTYQEAVAHLQELQPDAVIYLQAIMKVTTERSNKGDYISNQGIEDRNIGIAALADNIKIYYLDVNPLVVDENGGLNPDYTYDGVHLKGKHVAIWKDFLKEHAVVLD